MASVLHKTTPLQLPRALWRNRFLFAQLCRRDIAERYRGSVAGLVWSLASPLAMLAIYTFVFSVIFNARWGARATSQIDYALLLFAGLLTFGIFADCANRGPTLISAKPNFVKKVVFPLELVPLVALANALFHFASGFVILMVFCLVAYGSIPWTVVFVPLMLLPVMLLALAACWLLGSLGVFLHDLRHAVPLIVTALLFLTPVFYPVSQVPESIRWILQLNPLTFPIEHIRSVAIFGELPKLAELVQSLLLNGVLAVLCFLWFQRARKHFADVL